MSRIAPTFAVVSHRIPLCDSCGDAMVTMERAWYCADCETAPIRIFETPEPVTLRSAFPNRAARRSRKRQRLIAEITT